MSQIEIRKVVSRRDLRQFIEFHYDLYEGNAYDVPNLYSDEVNTLSQDRNAAFDFCEAEYYMAFRDGRMVGRVAAIINHRANERWQTKSVRFGWIDFVDDEEVSRALFKAVEDYGRSHGMTEMVGPLGFTDMDPEGIAKLSTNCSYGPFGSTADKCIVSFRSIIFSTLSVSINSISINRNAHSKNCDTT